MEYMKTQPDKSFDLAIVDPPYGEGDLIMTNNPTPKERKNKNRQKYDIKEWNNEKPTQEYWNELWRISKNQIIWGGNYFNLPISRGWIFWDKKFENTFNFSAGELAWTSFDKILKKYTLSSKSETKGGINRIHPNQKPVALYKWLLKNYAEPGQKILDTHLGSGSSAIAAHYFGCDFVGCEIDKEYYDAMMKRFKRETSQIAMFEGISTNISRLFFSSD